MISFFFNDTATTGIYTLSLHDALPIYPVGRDGLHARARDRDPAHGLGCRSLRDQAPVHDVDHALRARLGALRPRLVGRRSEEHTSELQSRQYLVCRLLLEKKIILMSSS